MMVEIIRECELTIDYIGIGDKVEAENCGLARAALYPLSSSVLGLVNRISIEK